MATPVWPHAPGCVCLAVQRCCLELDSRYDINTLVDIHGWLHYFGHGYVCNLCQLRVTTLFACIKCVHRVTLGQFDVKLLPSQIRSCQCCRRCVSLPDRQQRLCQAQL